MPLKQRLRVAELNQTFTTIIKEAQAHALATPHTDTPTAAQGPRLAVGRPRYQRARLVGERLVAELAQAYLAEVSQRLRPGSYKSVRFALGLLGSHLGKYAVGDLSLSHGKEVLGYITQLSPNVRKYREGKDAGLARACNALTGARGLPRWHPRPRPVSSSRCPSSLTGVLGKGSWELTPGSPQGEGQARGTSPRDADGRTGEYPAQRQGQGAAQCAALRAPHGYALRGDLWAHGGGYHSKGQPGALRQHQAQ